MKLPSVFAIGCFLYVSLSACPTDMLSAGVVLNDGEYFAFDKIEPLGQNGVNYITENIQISGQTTDTTIEQGTSTMGKVRRIAPPLSAVVVAESFNYDPNTSASFSPEPLFAFNNDTLIIHDYWALYEQPAFRCSLFVAHDTIFVSYLPATGIVLDWTPTVETVLKIKFNGYSRGIVCCFNAVTQHARSPRSAEVGFRDARTNRYTTVAIPPRSTYKYRAHFCPSAMICLSYEKASKQYQGISPRITVTFDSAAMRIKDATPFAGVLSEELEWLSAAGICTPLPTTIARLAALGSMGPSMSGGWCYWSKQDSTIALNQSFVIVNSVLDILRPRSVEGCGLGTEYSLPSGNLMSTGTVAPTKAYSTLTSSAMTAGVQRNVLNVASSESFDNMSVYNLLGREMYSVHFKVPLKNVSVTMDKNGCVPGNYVVFIGSANRQTGCKQILFQK